MLIAAKENKNALQKLIGNIRNDLAIETAKADNRKGKTVMHSRLTIGTDATAIQRIEEKIEASAEIPTRIPQRSPANQKNARMRRRPLRNRCGWLREKYRDKKGLPADQENEGKLAYGKSEGVHGTAITIPKLNTPILYSKIYKNSSFFGQNSFFCRL